MTTDARTHSSQDDPTVSRERAGHLAPAWPRRLATETFGTFALVFVAVGADSMAAVSGGAVSDAARAVAPGLLVAAMIYAIGDGSGAHFNPIVTLAFALKRLMPASWVGPYWAAQVTGAVAACLLVAVLFGDALSAGVSSPHVAAPTALALEATLTVLLLVVINGTADRFRLVGHEAALAVGGTVALCGLIALPVGGASMNPARSLAPALVAGRFGDVWIYVLGPLIAVPIAVLLTRLLHGPTERDPKAVEAALGTPVASGPDREDGGSTRRREGLPQRGLPRRSSRRQRRDADSSRRAPV